MSTISSLGTLPSSNSIKQYIVSGADGPSRVQVSFNPQSSATTKVASAGADSPAIKISIGTKNLDSSADVSTAINSAVYGSSQANVMVSQAATNIIDQADDAVRAASIDIPNEDVYGLLV